MYLCHAVGGVPVILFRSTLRKTFISELSILMRKDLYRSFAVRICAAVLFAASVVTAQTRTVGLLSYDSTKAFKGYTLFSPLSSLNTYLIDMNGMLVHKWVSAYQPGQSVMLLKDGNLLRPGFVKTGHPFTQGGAGGRVEKIDWNGNLLWAFNYYGSTYIAHHDIEYLPNGNVLLIAWEIKSLAEAVAMGRNATNATYTEIWSEKIVEVQPTGATTGTIVWEWHIWDHLIQDYDATKANYGVVSAHPELFDINFGDKRTDWLHMNAIRYNAERDEIMVSVHAIHEFWIIDHSTTTAEAAGHSGGVRGKGGDLLYRWGNPIAYKLGTAATQKLYSQHDARWIDPGLPGAGNILIYNNGTNRPGGAYSSIEQIVPPLGTDGSYQRNSGAAFGPETTFWTYKATPDTSFYSVNISGATRMANGNTVICEGQKGNFFEITSAGEKVWNYRNPVTQTGVTPQGQIPVNNPVFKIYRYAQDYPALTGKDLTPLGVIELPPLSAEENTLVPGKLTLSQNYPNPFNPETTIEYSVASAGRITLRVYDLLGNVMYTAVDEVKQPGIYSVKINAGGFPSGLYIYRLSNGNNTLGRKMLLLK